MEYKIIGYKYLTEQEAIEAVNNCNQYYNITKNEHDVTSSYCEYNKDLNDVYFIVQHETLIPVLGEPYEFYVVFDE